MSEYALPCHPTATAPADFGGIVRCPVCKFAYVVGAPTATAQARGKVVPTDLPFEQVRDTVPNEEQPQQEIPMSVTDTSTADTPEVADAEPVEAGEEKAAKSRASKGALEAQVREITDLYASGALTMHPAGRPLTPHNIAVYIALRNDLPKAPSAGAVTANLDRWEKIGFAVLSHEKPKSFVGYTPEATTVGLSELKARHRVGLSEAKKAEKEAAKSVAAPAPAEAHPVTADEISA